MTTQAEVLGLQDQLVGIISHMGIMTGETFLVRVQPAVLYLGLPDMLLFVVMTGEAEISFSIGREIVLKRSAVGAVTHDAPFLHRRVHMFFCLKSILLVGMAGKTNIVALGHEKLRIIAIMSTVADAAAADRYRTMDELSSGQALVMADKA